MILFHPGEWSVSHKELSITLLPKEYQLLEYLYRNDGITFTRDQLLDAVWPMETPTDRTVDDHIYRLRKKLHPWEGLLTIGTVRGAGYRLTVCTDSASASANPLLSDPAYTEQMYQLLTTNLRYGRGDALLTLAKQHEILGFRLDPQLQLYISFVEGDFRALAAASAPFEEKLFFLLHLYHQVKPEASRPFVEAALRERRLAANWQTELEEISLIYMLRDWGDVEQSHQLLRAALHRATAAASSSEASLYPFLSNLLLDYHLRALDWAEAEAVAQEIESRLADYPYQREEGQYWILKGILLYEQNPETALASIQCGLDTLRRSRFTPHYGSALEMILLHARSHKWVQLLTLYTPEWEHFMERTGLLEIIPNVEAALQQHLL